MPSEPDPLKYLYTVIKFCQFIFKNTFNLLNAEHLDTCIKW